MLDFKVGSNIRVLSVKGAVRHKVGDIGQIVEIDKGQVPYLVNVNGFRQWYIGTLGNGTQDIELV